MDIVDSQLCQYYKEVSNLVEKALNSFFECQEETMYLKALYEWNQTFKN